MANVKAVIGFGSTNFTIYSGGTLLNRPSALIIKKSLHPTVICTGEDALRRKDDVSGDEMFVRPIKKGAVAHYEGVRLMIKEYVRSVFGFDTGMELCVLISCGLDAEQKKEIEKAFVSCGYANVYLMERLLALSGVAESAGMNVVAYLGGDVSEVGIVKNNSLISGYSLDLGGNRIAARFGEKIKEKYRLNLSDEEIVKLKHTLASLFNSDLSVAEATGIDILTGKPKRLVLRSKDISEDVNYVFTRIVKLINGALTVAPNWVVENVVSHGIFIAGRNSSVSGLAEYIYKKLTLPSVCDEYAALVGAENLLYKDNGKWVEEVYLKL